MNIEFVQYKVTKAEFNPVVLVPYWSSTGLRLMTAALNAHLNLNLQLSAIFYIFARIALGYIPWKKQGDCCA